MGERHIYRDSVTGEIVTREYAETHPATTQRETVTVPDEDRADPCE